MVEPNCGVPEERWVDWHSGRLAKETASALRRHLEVCGSCRIAARHWGELLGVEEKESGADTADMPSDTIRRSLRRRMWKRAGRKWLETRSGWSLAGAAAALLLMIGFALPRWITEEPTKLEPKVYAQLHEPQGVSLMSRPDTVVYSLNAHARGEDTVLGGASRVTVWVNGRTEEMFVLLEGLLPSDSRDVQAWGAVDRRLTNIGLLEFHRTQGHLYTHVSNLPEVEELRLTIEPKGGSLQPTAPESASVKLAAKR